MSQISISDLDLTVVEVFLEETGQADLSVDIERLLRNWRLLSGEHPTIAGIVLFGRKPQQHLPFAQINAVRFPGIDSSVDPLDVRDWSPELEVAYDGLFVWYDRQRVRILVLRFGTLKSC